MDPRGDHLDSDDHDRLYGLCAAVGTDELLGCYGDHQSILGDPGHRSGHRYFPVGRLYGRQSDFEPLLRAPLPAALYYSRRRIAASHRIASFWVQQPAGHRHEGSAGHLAVPSVFHDQGFVRARGIFVDLFLFYILRAEFSRKCGQLHSGKPDANPEPHRAGMVLASLLCNFAIGAQQVARRNTGFWLDFLVVHRAMARYVAGAQRPVSPGLQMGFWLLVIDVAALGWVGANPPEGLVVTVGQIATLYYFVHFLILFPVIGRLERPRPLPASIAAAVLQGGAAARLGGAGAPLAES